MSAKTVSAIECRFAVYAKADDGESDLHLIKEKIHYDDGSIEPNVRLIRDFQRPFWVAKKGKQNHADKKEWVDVTDVVEFKSTQTKLGPNIAKALGKAWMKNPNVRDLSESPYLYGSDILSTSLLKQSYRDKWDMVTPFTNAVFDTETDVVHMTGTIQMATLSFKKRVVTVVQKSFVKGYADPIGKIRELAELYIGDVIKARSITLEIILVDTEIDIIRIIMARAHEWKPDFLSVWNLAFDMKKVMEACERAGVKIADLLSDPKVPPKYRSFRFKEGAAKKVTNSGKVMNYKPAQRWHTVFCPSSFYWIDAMCVYKQVRTGAPEEPSYGLDAILKKDLKIGKLKFKEADHLTGLEWHQFMQSKYPLEYVVYNIFDCVSMEMLDEKTLDLQLSLPMQAGCSDFSQFNSQPRRTANEMHSFCLKHGKVFGSTASEMAGDFDEETATVKDWIVMLPSHLVADNGLKLIEENPDMPTNARGHVGDLDVSASYPTGECVFNISKETTRNELIDIDGVTNLTQRMAGINLSAGKTNAVECAVALYGVPTFDALLEAFTRQA